MPTEGLIPRTIPNARLQARRRGVTPPRRRRSKGCSILKRQNFLKESATSIIEVGCAPTSIRLEGQVWGHCFATARTPTRSDGLTLRGPASRKAGVFGLFARSLPMIAFYGVPIVGTIRKHSMSVLACSRQVRVHPDPSGVASSLRCRKPTSEDYFALISSSIISSFRGVHIESLSKCAYEVLGFAGLNGDAFRMIPPS